MVNLEVRINPPGKSIFSSLLYTIDDVYRYFNPFIEVSPQLSLNGNNISIAIKSNSYFEPEKVFLGKERHEVSPASNKFLLSILKTKMKEYCQDNLERCPVEIKYSKIDKRFQLKSINVSALVKEGG